jgi:hypothetical protein
MKRFVALALLGAASLLPAPRAWADLDAIPLTTLAFGQKLDLFFPNQVHPVPSRKVLQFTGFAEASGPPGIAALLGIHFDYLDSTGATVIVPLPNFYQEAIQPGAGPVPINAGPVVLPFCPPNVSIHFENLTEGTEISLSGMYDHTCVIIPEPGSAALVAIACALIARRRK